MTYDASIQRYIFAANPRQVLRVLVRSLRWLATWEEREAARCEELAQELRKQKPTRRSDIVEVGEQIRVCERRVASCLEILDRLFWLLAAIEWALEEYKDEESPVFAKLLESLLEVLTMSLNIALNRPPAIN